MYKIIFTSKFERSYKRITKVNRILKTEIDAAISILALNPHDPKLRTHQIKFKDNEKYWSSRVNGDIRILWQIDDMDKSIIIAFDIGGHSGSKKVYK